MEHAHQVIVNALFWVAGSKTKEWPVFIYAVLLVICCTIPRMTGYTPYYLLYGHNPLLVFNIVDCTWETLDWDKVITTEDLIVTHTLQIGWRDSILTDALEWQKPKCQCLVDNFNRKYEKYFVDNNFDIGTWVLIHETWLNSEHGNKGAPHWLGPFAIHQKLSNHSYRLREIDGTVKRGKVVKNQLKYFITGKKTKQSSPYPPQAWFIPSPPSTFLSMVLCGMGTGCYLTTIASSSTQYFTSDNAQSLPYPQLVILLMRLMSVYF